ncbi:urea carboxylase [Acidithiobacillus albertensis]|uniref:urea carboxylase n=1 Tax=Acidithiobacillus albertensis TaxID=119978 RepID=UPI00094B4F6A|nr:urea carboxylase [Acidithiobacillus albertensis]
MFDTVLIANRGAIACRIIRTLRNLGVRSVAVYSEADRDSAHVRLADEAICIGAAPAAQSYLQIDHVLDAARKSGAQAIHPGYGFLSENADFAEACELSGIAFIGPTPSQMRDFGLKHTARKLAKENNIPLLPGSALLKNAQHALEETRRIGCPVMLKSTAGGGGIGMQLVRFEEDVPATFERVDRLARASFKESGIYIEKYVEAARHVEVQVFGDGKGHVVHLGERDCSLQRRNQKVIEETPAPNLTDELRAEICETALQLMRNVHYRSAGTVEFIVDAQTGNYYFLEVNTRLQVEHGVTEEVSGVDLVEWMIRLAAGESPESGYVHQPQGHSIQARLYAEDPAKNFQPATGIITEVHFPEDARIETWVELGTEVTAYYDPMIAKIIVHGANRADALNKLSNALCNTSLYGFETNLQYLRTLSADSVVSAGRQTTQYLSCLKFSAHTVDVLEPGVQTMLQDWPGRLGYWDVGVPPSGPMDALAHRLANQLLENPSDAVSMEILLSGPVLRFNVDTQFAITGAEMGATLDGKPCSNWTTHVVRAGQVLRLGDALDGGCRAYLAVSGGFDVPLYLGSRATFTLGQFGGHAGRVLRAGDVLHLADRPAKNNQKVQTVPIKARPSYPTSWEIGVIYGPHGAPDFFTEADIEMLFKTDWVVHYNSNRTGIRLIGPKPEWAREDGGEAGLHPSNIHDNAYAIGSIDFTGDMPIILGPDGPSLGGFVCPGVVIKTDLWKLGQLCPGNKVRFIPIDNNEAVQREKAQEKLIAELDNTSLDLPLKKNFGNSSPVIAKLEQPAHPVGVTYRIAGDANLLVEYGSIKLDLELRLRAHALVEWIQQQKLQGIIDLTPGIRSLQVHYDNNKISLKNLLDLLMIAESKLPPVEDMIVESRILHLPLSWDDPATQLAIEKYMTGVRNNAPWCPSNIEFIRRINGLESIKDVMQIVFDATYLVLGLGDVYLGAPVATPLDPRHRLVTTKYNPARTWTPENAVGIGGAYLCIYGLEGPGGYQFVGRTLQMWNRWKNTKYFIDNKPWLLRPFDQIRFFPVSHKDLKEIREDFIIGRYDLEITKSNFSAKNYKIYLKENQNEIISFQKKQRKAFDDEKNRWIESGQAEWDSQIIADNSIGDQGGELKSNETRVNSPVSGSLWKILVKLNQQVNEGDVLCILESMKMEISVIALSSGKITGMYCKEGGDINVGQRLFVIEN